VRGAPEAALARAERDRVLRCLRLLQKASTSSNDGHPARRTLQRFDHQGRAAASRFTLASRRCQNPTSGIREQAGVGVAAMQQGAGVLCAQTHRIRCSQVGYHQARVQGKPLAVGHLGKLANPSH